MKLLVYWLSLLVLVVMQIVVGQSFGVVFAVPLSLIAIIVLAGFVSTEQLLYMAFTAGLILDINSGRDFGINLSYLIVVALFCKLVMHLGQRDQNWVNVLVLSGLLVVLYDFLLITLVFSSEQLNQIGQYASRLSISLVTSLVWTLVLYALATKLNQSELSFKFVHNTRYVQKLKKGSKQ